MEAFLLNMTMERPWLTAEDYKPVNDRIERLKVQPPPHRAFNTLRTHPLPALQSWLANKTKEQSAKAPHEEPAFRVSEIPGRVDIVANAGKVTWPYRQYRS